MFFNNLKRNFKKKVFLGHPSLQQQSAWHICENLANNAKHTIGNINVEISNNSRFKYDGVEIVLDFKSPRGSTLISRKVRIDDYIDPYKEKLFLDVPIGYIDFDVTNLEIHVADANMIGYVKTVEKAKKLYRQL